MLLPLLIAVLVLVLAGPAQARPQSSFNWNPHSEHRLIGLDTQPGVVNTTPCAWNDQDNITDLGTGQLSAGQSTSHRMCLVADYDDTGNVSTSIYPKAIAFEVYAPHDGLRVVLRNDVGERWTAGPSVAYGSRRLTQLCVSDPVADAANSPDPLWSFWPQVPGTTGSGRIVNYTLEVSSPTRRTRDIWAYFEIHGGGDVPAYAPRTLDVPCPEPDFK